MTTSSLNNGVGVVSGTGYQLSASVGESVFGGSLTGTGYTLRSGFTGDAGALGAQVTLVSSVNPSTYAQSLTLTATVTGTNPGGSVAFLDNGLAPGASFSRAVFAFLLITVLHLR